MPRRGAYIAPSVPAMRTRSRRPPFPIPPRATPSASSGCRKRVRRDPAPRPNSTGLLHDLDRRLVALSDATYQRTIFKYMRGTVPTLGLRMPAIQRATREWAAHNAMSSMSATQAKQVALSMFELPALEHKLAAVLILHEQVQARGVVGVEDLAALARLFDDGLVYGWGVTDAMASRVIRGIAEGGGEAASEAVAQWRFADNLWRARSSVVGLLWMARRERGCEMLLECCRVVVRREERFAKTCVGWALREMARRDEKTVCDFLDEHIKWCSLESVRNATKRCSDAQRAKYVALVKNASRAESN